MFLGLVPLMEHEPAQNEEQLQPEPENGLDCAVAIATSAQITAARISSVAQ